MTKTADCVIIGGGISGYSIAFNLAKRGMKNIVVLDKSYQAAGATGRCGAGIRQQWGTEMNCKLGKLSNDYFETAKDDLQYPGDIEFKQGGYLILAYTEKEVEQFKKNIILQNSLGIQSKMLTPEDAREIVPYLNTKGILAATFHQKDGHLNPFTTLDAFATAAKRLGVEGYNYVEATGIVVQNGEVKAVETTMGTISTPLVVNTAGGWSKQVAEMAGIDIPVFSERHQILVTEPVEPMLGPMVMSFSGNLYCQQVPHGSFVMGRGDAGEPQDLRVTSGWHFVEEMAKTITDLLPPLRELRVVRQWAGLYNITPDRQPIYGPVQGVKGYHLAVGYSGHGFMFAPATGILMAEKILGLPMTMDIDMLSLDRFAKGELIFEPSVV